MMAKRSSKDPEENYTKKSDRANILEQHQAVIKFLNHRSVYQELINTFPPTSTELALLHLLLRTDRPVLAKEAADSVNRTEGAISQAANRLSDMLIHFFECHKTFLPKNISVCLPRGTRGGAHFGYYLSFLDIERKALLHGADLERLLGKISVGQKLKYFRTVKDVLRLESSEDAKWFRKSGPIAADLNAGYVYMRNNKLDQLKKLVHNNKVSILEGKGGHGKSVLVRSHAYKVLKKASNSSIYHYSFKNDPAIIDFHDFLAVLIDINGLVIIEDIHLASDKILYLINVFNERGKGQLLLTTRSSLWANLPDHQKKGLKNLPRMKLEKQDCSQDDDCNDDIDMIIQNFIKQQTPRNFEWTSQLLKKVRDISNGDLWLLSYALKGCDGKSEPVGWIKNETQDDLKYIASQGYNPEILVALSYLYKNEVPMSQHFLRNKLDFDRKEILDLIKMGEVTKKEIDGEMFYGLPHSSLAIAYFRHGTEYKHCLKYSDESEMVYQYAITGAPGGLKLIVNQSYIQCNGLLDRLANERKALSVIENESKENYRTLTCFTDICIKDHKLNDYYCSNDFIESYMKILLEKQHIKGLSDVYKKYPNCGSDLWNNIDENFFDELFSDDENWILIYSFADIVKANPKTKVKIVKSLKKELDVSVEFYSYCPSNLYSNIQPFYWLDHKITEAMLSTLDLKVLAEQLKCPDVSEANTDVLDFLPCYRFDTMQNGKDVFRTVYNVELLLIFIEVRNTEEAKKLIRLIGLPCLQKLIDDSPIFVRMKFLLTLYKLNINTSLFRQLISENIEKYVKVFMSLPKIDEMYLDETYLDNITNETDPQLGQNLYRLIYEEIGLNQYFKKIRETKSDELLTRCCKFLSEVDPKNMQGWKQIFEDVS